MSSPLSSCSFSIALTLLYLLNRYADDEDMNDELKERERWNDPAANFLTVSFPLSLLRRFIADFVPREQKKKEKKSKGPRFPKYAGPSPAPNRFGIPPGYRWDGVDRVSRLFKLLLLSVSSAPRSPALPLTLVFVLVDESSAELGADLFSRSQGNGFEAMAMQRVNSRKMRSAEAHGEWLVALL